MKSEGFHLVWLTILLVILIGCAPKSVPITAPTQTSPPTTTVTASNFRPTTSQDVPDKSGQVAWNKVVEAAQKEQKVTIYSYNWVGDTGLEIARAFKNKYGIEVDIVTGRGAEFLERLKTERRVRQITADFTEGSPLHVLNMKKEGITTSLSDLDVLKSTDDFVVAPDRLDPEKNVLVFRISYMTAWVNSRLVKQADEPRSWSDLLQPKWKGKILVTDPQIAGTPYQLFTPLIRAGNVNLGFIEALGKQDLNFVTGEVESGRALAKGDFPLAATGSNTSLNRFVQEGASIKPVFLEDGTTGIGGSVGAIKDSPHPNAAKLFGSWLFSQEGQEVVSKAQQVPMNRKGVRDYSPPGTELKPKKLVFQTEEDNDSANQMFRDKVFSKLWGK